MRKRNVHIQFWLDKKEAEAFQKKVKKSGLSREAYLRHLVNGLEPQDAPPPDYYAMMRELHGIGNNLNQIAAKAHTLNALDVQRYDENCRKLDEAIKTIRNPQKEAASPGVNSVICSPTIMAFTNTGGRGASTGTFLIRTLRTARVSSAAIREAAVPKTRSSGYGLARLPIRQPMARPGTAAGVKIGRMVSASEKRNWMLP